MTTKPDDANSPDRPGSGHGEAIDIDPAARPNSPSSPENNRSETVLPPSQPEIVKVKAPPARGANPFLKHFVDEPAAAERSGTKSQPHEKVGPGDVEESLDALDDQVLTESLERDGDKPEDPLKDEAPEPELSLEDRQSRDPHPSQEDQQEPIERDDPIAHDSHAEELHPRDETVPEQNETEPPVIVSAVPEIGPEPLPAIPFVAFKGVQKTFDGKSAVVADLNLNVAKGEFLTLLGPSGSGKTTTLMMLAGFEEPTQGYIELDGLPISHLPPHKRNIGMVFQNYALFPHMSVAENVAFPLRVRGTPGREVRDRVAQALKKVSLEGFDKRKPFQLSGGQQQRVAVARALVFNPALVLMDEPLGALDRHLREQMQFEIKRLHRDMGLTIVYVTHDQSEALTLSDRIAVFHDGRIQQVDTPEALYESPANAFVATFVGENNKLNGSVISADQDNVVVRLDGGQTVTAERRDCGGVGSRAVVTVRPEHVRLARDAEPQAGESLVEAHVEEVVFHGDHMRVKLIVPGGGELLVKSPGRIGGLRGDTVYAAFRIQNAPAFRPME